MTTDAGEDIRRAAVVTGGGAGIGRAVARELAAHGYGVLVVGRTERTLEETADGYDSIHPLVADITAADAPSVIVATALERFGRIDVLVNNASIALPRSLSDITADSLDTQLAVNLRAPILLTSHAVDALAATGGIVVNMSSAGSLGRRGWPYFTAYGATKVGLDFLTRTWSIELAPLGIRVVAVAPGVIDRGPGGAMGADADAYHRFLSDIAERTPLRRVGETTEVAWWISQLVKPEAAFATGTIFVLDGGLSVT
ncbi:SDR family oxidoreductase [Saccharothrix sp. S26]|uniref:SDR family NAD(P)-dependent oxidoreductase n=1 Tax=Saccharothrix sp. S26 TaxID=2907215 RepID=UPI001F3FBAA2|nr:SDR family oxidoreductase [Saccharothrix sp. S26]MCE6995363.1 SDR family oxidoreductase [Saccharothrix sp. S26]